MYLMIDNYDSFVYNLKAYFEELGKEIAVIRCDKITLEEIEDMQPSGIILSPGPKRPQDRVALPDVPKAFAASRELEVNATHKDRLPVDYVMNGHQYQLPDGAVVIAAITSCTNTSNPSVLMAAGLLAKKRRNSGPQAATVVQASLAPGSKRRF